MKGCIAMRYGCPLPRVHPTLPELTLRRAPQRMYEARIRELWAEEPTRQAPVVVPIALQLNDADRRVRRR